MMSSHEAFNPPLIVCQSSVFPFMCSFLCFWDWEKSVLINMTWISFCQAYRQFLFWLKSVQCEVVYRNQARPVDYGKVVKLLIFLLLSGQNEIWHVRLWSQRFSCNLRHRSAIAHQTGLFFHVVWAVLLLVEKWEPHRIR